MREILLTDPKLEAELVTMKFSETQEFRSLMFVCPACDNGHAHLIPFDDGPGRRILREVSGREQVIWKRESGQGLEDLTLSPSYATSCLHIFVRGGKVEIL